MPNIVTLFGALMCVPNEKDHSCSVEDVKKVLNFMKIFLMNVRSTFHDNLSNF